MTHEARPNRLARARPAAIVKWKTNLLGSVTETSDLNWNPMNPTLSSPLFFFISGFGMLQSLGDLHAQERNKFETVYLSTQNDITVPLDRVAAARILNTPAWLKAKERESKWGQEVVAGLREHLPAGL